MSVCLNAEDNPAGLRLAHCTAVTMAIGRQSGIRAVVAAGLDESPQWTCSNEGFYDDVAPLGETEKKALDAMPDNGWLPGS
jgi:hypothetical protein